MAAPLHGLGAVSLRFGETVFATFDGAYRAFHLGPRAFDFVLQLFRNRPLLLAARSDAHMLDSKSLDSLEVGVAVATAVESKLHWWCAKHRDVATYRFHAKGRIRAVASVLNYSAQLF